MKTSGLPSIQCDRLDRSSELPSPHGPGPRGSRGALSKPKVWDPLLQILSVCGAVPEQSYVEKLTEAGLDVVRIDVTATAITETRTAMPRGAPVIVRAALTHQGWNGRILRRVETPSGIGCWSYEPVDTKLARETKAGSPTLSLC